MSNHTEPQTFYCLLLNSPDIGGTIIMADLKNILKHFDEAAENYNERCLSFPWSWIRAAEWRAVSGLVRDVKGQTLLDLGCGAGLFSLGFRNLGVAYVHAVDASSKMVENLKGQHGVTTTIVPIEDLALPDKYDLIIATGLLEFLEKPETLFDVAMLHAKPSTKLLVLYPYDGLITRIYKCYHRRNGINIRVPSWPELCSIAEKCGWNTIENHWATPISAAAAFSVILPKT